MAVLKLLPRQTAHTMSTMIFPFAKHHLTEEGAVVPISILSLIIGEAPSPSVVVLKPQEEARDEFITRIVPIWIGPTEATQLGASMEHLRYPRPMTHDLFLDALTNLDAHIEQVIIDDAKGTTFKAKLLLRQHGRLIRLDSRPSDALSLAVRQSAPMFIEDRVLDRVSFPYIHKAALSENPEAVLADFHSFLSTLSPDDFVS